MILGEVFVVVLLKYEKDKKADCGKLEDESGKFGRS